MSQAVEFAFDLSNRDLDIMRTLKTVLQIEKRSTFSADDLFLFGLDRFFPDKTHGIGRWFARMQHHKYIEPVGRKRSTQEKRHMAVNRLYELTGKDLK